LSPEFHQTLLLSSPSNAIPNYSMYIVNGSGKHTENNRYDSCLSKVAHKKSDIIFLMQTYHLGIIGRQEASYTKLTVGNR
jgi:hypothetical protein